MARRGTARRRSGAGARSSFEGMRPRAQGPDFDRRAARVGLAVVLCLLVVTVRLVYVQLIKGGDYGAEAASHRVTTEVLHARRGTIYDRNGNVLAMSVARKNVCCNPSAIDDADAPAAADVLAAALGGSSADYLDTLRGESTFAYLAYDADVDAADEVVATFSSRGWGGLWCEDTWERVHPFGDVGGQVIGLLDDQGQGQSGLELYYDDELSGTDGSRTAERGANGEVIAGAEVSETPAQDGKDIHLSLDINVQRKAEEVIAQAVEDYDAQSGSVMVEDPATGEIVAACSTPLATISDRSQLDVSSISLKLVSDSYEPGSVFKVLTLGIGFDRGLFTPDTSYAVPPQLLVGDDYVSDWDGRVATETLSVREILARSSNTGSALLAQDVIGTSAFAQGVDRFGIGHLTGIDFPGEVKGIVRDPAAYDSSTAGFMSFGQSVAVPMVQVVRAFAGVANDGVALTPHFATAVGDEELDWSASTRVISPSASRQLVECMRAVVSEGTATAAAIEGYDVVGKTGTGEQSTGLDEGYASGLYVSSFCGFLEGSDPQLLVYVGLNGTPFHSNISAGLFPTIMQEAIDDLGIAPEG